MNLIQINSLSLGTSPVTEEFDRYYFALLSGDVKSVADDTAIVNIMLDEESNSNSYSYIPDEGSTLIVNNDFSSNDCIGYIEICFNNAPFRRENRFKLDGGLSVGSNILYFIKDTSNNIYKFVNLTQKMSNVIPITHGQLLTLRDNGRLIPGMQYRITDFVTSVIRNDLFTSALNPFDIIVTASSSSTLNEDAKAALHDGDRYFVNCDIDSWELKYCIDNATNRFDWVNPNPAEGKGVIYYMKDDLGNECPYDFKNIMMYDREMSSMVYTFTAKPGTDASVMFAGDSSVDSSAPHNNVIRALHTPTPAGNIQSLNNIIFRGFPCNENYIGENCQNIFFGSYCNKNIIGDNCSGITFMSGEYNELGNDCRGILFGNGCHHNTLGFNCSNITFGEECTFNTFGFGCSDISFVEVCELNKFGNECSRSEFGVGSSFNTFGDRCIKQFMANKTQYNTFGDDCGGNIFGEWCSYNRLGNGCISIAMGYGCWNNTFENDCRNIAFFSGPEMHGNYYRYNKFGQGCNNIELNSIDIIPPGSVQPNGIKPSPDVWVQNYNFINILYDGNVVPITAERGLIYETKIARDINGVVRIYNDFLTTNVTYNKLVELRNSNMLTPGMQYRITDFVTTVIPNDGTFVSASNPFDVIVTASSSNTLNEDAKAALHDGDTYFANCDIDSWELKYCIDNDPNRFDWANPKDGKGVIYYMKDDLGNECPYDFKNIMMLDREFSAMVHTFVAKPGMDASLWIGDSSAPRNNVIRALHIPSPAGNIQSLNFIIFRWLACNDNYIGENCNNIFFGGYCNKNIIGTNCSSISFGEECSNNELGNDCSHIAFGSCCSNDEFGNGCTSIIMGYGCLNNIFENNCFNIIFNSMSAPDLYGNYYRFNKFCQGCNNIELNSMDIIRPGEFRPDNLKPTWWVQNYNFINNIYDGNVVSITAERGLMYETKIARDTEGVVRIYNDFLITNVTYDKLVELRNTNMLIPGMQYRITDFVTTTTATNTMSAGHQFDIIVTASSNNTLNEEAKATLHCPDVQTSPQYFANCNIDSWELKYYIANDNTRFEWADTSNGKGVIYYMKDELGNEACYDFKNIMFKNPLDTSDKTWYYTFTDPIGNDLSVVGNSCYENKIKGYYSGLQLKLNNIIFKYCQYSNANVFEYNCYDIIFAGSGSGNIFGYGCCRINIGDMCYYNTIESLSHHITFGNEVASNTIGKGCTSINFGTSCQFNKIGDFCSSIKFGDSCDYNNIGEFCNENTFGYNCEHNTFGNGCNSNTFGEICGYNTFGKNSYSNTFGNNCQYNTFGDNCHNITFSSINGDKKCYFKNINFENECQYMTIIEDTPYNTTSKLYVQNYVFMNSASGVYNNIQNYTTNRGNAYSTKVAKASDGTLKTYCEEDGQSNQTNITYSDLVILKDNAKLVPGMQYRITDYVTTTTKENTMSAGHQFDVIITASSNNALNEDAKAALHDGDTYFANCNIDSWELKYRIDNDTDRFEWADTTNGKGVIYYMKDNGGNEACYDFKNIMFKNPLNADDTTWYYTFTNTDGSDFSLLVDLCYENKIKEYYKYYSISQSKLKLNNIIFNCINAGITSMYKNVFGYNCYNNTFGYNCYRNTFGDYCHDITFVERCHDITFGHNCYNITFGSNCQYNTFGNDCHSNTFGDECERNTIGNGSHDMTFGNRCSDNTFGNYCHTNTFGNYCTYNTFASECQNNTCLNSCSGNTLGNNCHDISFEDGCSDNTFGNNCHTNAFGEGCSDNTFGNDCHTNTFGNYCTCNTFVNECQNNTFGRAYQSNTFGNACQNNTFGEECNRNTFGNGCHDMTFGFHCIYNTFGYGCSNNTFGDACSNNTFGNACTNITFSTISGDANCYFKNINFENECKYMTLIENVPSTGSFVQNYVFKNGVSGHDGDIKEYTLNRGYKHSTKVAMSSNGTLRIYCEDDI